MTMFGAVVLGALFLASGQEATKEKTEAKAMGKAFELRLSLIHI